MDEFEFLRAMFRRLSEAEAFAADARTKKQTQRQDAWETAALGVKCSIKDYLSLRSAHGVNVEGRDDGR